MSSIDRGPILIGQPDPNRPEASVEEIMKTIGEAIENLRQSRKINPRNMDTAIKTLYAMHMQACGEAIKGALDDSKPKH